MIKVEKMYPDSIIPRRAHPGDSGLDLVAHSFKRVYYHTGGNSETHWSIDSKVSVRVGGATTLVMKPCSRIEGDTLELQYLERALIGTGIKATVGVGFELQIRPRSSLAIDNGLSILNTPATIDEGYRGEIGVILINLSRSTKNITLGDKIAQLVVCPVCLDEVTVVDKLPYSVGRGDNGFGSTGVR